MSHPNLTSYRYRLVTFDRYDLIFDVTKSKQQWAIKALFIAPADPLLHKIARSLPPAEVKQQTLPADGGKPAESPVKEEEKVSPHKVKH